MSEHTKGHATESFGMASLPMSVRLNKIKTSDFLFRVQRFWFFVFCFSLERERGSGLV